MELSFCRRLPKLELHAHLNGSLSEKTLKELYFHHGMNDSKQFSGWDSSNFIKDSYSLSSFFALFKMTYTLTSTPESVQIATERVIEDFANDNVVYLELRSTLRKERNMTKKDYLESMIKGVLKCKEKFPNINVKLIISINRSETIESAKENVSLTFEYLKEYPDIIVGLDTSGNPTNSKFNDYIKILELARTRNLKVTVHCAEVAGNEEIKEILEFHPNRIGHGTYIHESRGGDSRNWNLLLEKKIPVELCLSSNIKCKTVESFENHHFKLLYAAKHPITIATDDKGAFSTTLSEEFEIIQKTFGLPEKELWKLSYDSIDYSFANDIEKESLRTLLNQWRIGTSEGKNSVKSKYDCIKFITELYLPKERNEHSRRMWPGEEPSEAVKQALVRQKRKTLKTQLSSCDFFLSYCSFSIRITGSLNSL